MQKRKVALVLSGGGARGIAHIGAIEALEEAGFEISSVAGTSMGALVGGMFAAGRLAEFRDWICSLDRYKVLGMVDLAFSSEGLVKGNRVMKALKSLVPDVRIERLAVPFAAVSADLVTGREVVFDHGDLFGAVRASISIPSVFQPVRYNGMFLSTAVRSTPCRSTACSGSPAIGSSLSMSAVRAPGCARRSIITT